MNLTAKEVGRMLVLRFGGAEPGMDPEDAALADANVRRIVVPPVTAAEGLRIWQHYARILFSTTEEAPETEAIVATRIATGTWAEEDAPEQERADADARWAVINELRHAEAEVVCQISLYWNAQGGGQDVVDAFLQDGHPKAQELLLTRNQLWNVYSRLAMLTRSPSSESENETPRPDGSSGTNTPPGTSNSGARDAFGIRRTDSEQPATSTPPSSSSETPA